MDPLSISASILTVLATLNGGLNIANRLLNAPEELQALRTELSDLDPVIHNISNLPEDYLAQGGLKSSLLATKGILLELEALICYRLTKASGTRVDRSGWASHKTRIDRLREQLRNKKVALTTIIVVLSSSSSIGIERSLNNVQESLQNVQQEQREIRGMLSSLADRWVQQEERMKALSMQEHTAIQNQERLAIMIQNLQVPALVLSSHSELSTSQNTRPLQQTKTLDAPASFSGMLAPRTGWANIERSCRTRSRSGITLSSRDSSVSSTGEHELFYDSLPVIDINKVGGSTTSDRNGYSKLSTTNTKFALDGAKPFDPAIIEDCRRFAEASTLSTKTMMMVTTSTIIFLPISFVVSLYSMT